MLRSRSPFLSALVFLLVLPAAMVAAPLVPAAPAVTPLLLRGGTVHPVTGPAIVGADILITNGKITAIGPKLTVPRGARVIDVAGRQVYPGLIAANTSLGVQEISAVAGTRDVAEAGRINPNARAQVAVNPDNSHLGVTRLNGVLSALVTPLSESAGSAPRALIAGQSALIRLEGWTWEDMTVRASVALHLYWPSVTIDPVEPESSPIDRFDAVIPAMSNVAPLAATLTVPVVASVPAWATDSVPVLIVVLPV